jgi:integrase/recombinase XerD
VTPLRQLMLDELQRRNYSPATVRSYVHAVEEFATYFHRSPEQLGPEHVRDYQVHLFRDRKLSPRTIEGQAAALRFLFVKTLGRPYLPDAIPFPKHHRRLPTVLSQQEVSRLTYARFLLVEGTLQNVDKVIHIRARQIEELNVTAAPTQSHDFH